MASMISSSKTADYGLPSCGWAIPLLKEITYYINLIFSLRLQIYAFCSNVYTS
jgi:hypothetical protein